MCHLKNSQDSMKFKLHLYNEYYILIFINLQSGVLKMSLMLIIP